MFLQELKKNMEKGKDRTFYYHYGNLLSDLLTTTDQILKTGRRGQCGRKYGIG